MKRIIGAFLIIASIILLVVFALTISQIGQEEQGLKTDLQRRSTLLAESFRETVEPNFVNKSNQYLQGLVEKFDNQGRFAGLAIYDRSGNSIAVSASFPATNSASKKVVQVTMDTDRNFEEFTQFKTDKMYLLAVPLHDNGNVTGALMIAQNANYIDERLKEIWLNNLIRLSIQATLLSLAIFLLVRWVIFEAMRGMSESLREARIGETSQTSKKLSFLTFSLFQPLTQEISNIKKSLWEARSTASEEARLRLEKFDSPWTAERLKEFAKDTLKGRAIFVVSNREPYIHTKKNGEITYYFPASGMVTAIEPVIQSCGGTWIAHGSGDADKATVDKDDKIRVPPDEPKYTLRRIWLTKEEEEGYYNGFSNEALWPLCHIVHARPIFRKEDWEQYKKVNGKFAQAVISEIKNSSRPIILIQDFHLALLPKMIKNARPDATIGIFWHIPWPNSESFSICPWKKEILSGMQGADLIGFHTQFHCNNYVETVGKELESLIDYEHISITRGGHTSYIKPFPISIAFPEDTQTIEKTNETSAQLLKTLNIKTKYIGLGVDRLDYTKGILERLKVIEYFLTKFPVYQRNLTFIQIGAPSRSKIPRYKEFASLVEKETERINNRFKKKDWKPILLLNRHHDRKEVYQFYKLANFCLVTSLHDGMNLVAKEFVAARSDKQGVLILSQFTGASRELKDALFVNPYNIEETADTIKTALEMTQSEQTKRMRRLRDVVRNYNVYRWSAELLKTMANLG